MTVSSTTNKIRYEGNGVTDTFAFTGRIFSAADLKVEIITRATDALVEPLTLTTDYSVTINGDESASIEVTNATKIPSSLQDIQIRRELAQTQTLDLPTGTVFPASSVESALDKITSTLQDLSETVDRAVVIPVTSSGTPPDVIALLEETEAAADAAETAQAAAESAQVSAVAAAAEAEVIVGFDGSAGSIIYDNSTSGLTADDIQAAIDEVKDGGLSYASQAEAEAGTAEDKPMNALRTAEAIAAQVVAATTGDAKITIKSSESGWVLMDDGTIGSAASGATSRANADTEALYSLLWTNVSDTYAPVTGGRGASAAADFAANKPIALIKVLGRALASAGDGADLTSRALGETLGNEAHVLTIPELPAHTHTDTYTVRSGTGILGNLEVGSDLRSTTKDSGSTGGDAAHNNMQPSSFWNVLIKL